MTNEEAIEHLKNINSRYPCSLDSTFRDECEQIALNLAIEALEKSPQGEWIKNTDTIFKNRFNCSICGKLIFEPKEENNYCSKCGANMKKGGAE